MKKRRLRKEIVGGSGKGARWSEVLEGGQESAFIAQSKPGFIVSNPLDQTHIDPSLTLRRLIHN